MQKYIGNGLFLFYYEVEIPYFFCRYHSYPLSPAHLPGGFAKAFFIFHKILLSFHKKYQPFHELAFLTYFYSKSNNSFAVLKNLSAWEYRCPGYANVQPPLIGTNFFVILSNPIIATFVWYLPSFSLFHSTSTQN